jgi:hypothetical protein
MTTQPHKPGRPSLATIRAEQQEMLAYRLGRTCSHGKTWDEECPECELVGAREFVRRYGPMIDEARAKIEELTKREVKT